MKELSQAILSVMNDINGVAKNMTVWAWTSSAYKWVSDKDVKEKIREAMIKFWLTILPTDIESKIQVDRWEEVDPYSKSVPKDLKSKQSVFTEVKTKYILMHTSWESIEIAWYGQGVDTQDKGAGKATTYALKNTLLNMFLIPTWVDTDNTHSDELDVPKNKPTEYKKQTVDTPTGGTKPKTLTSTNEFCPECWEECKTKHGTTKEWKPYEMGNCDSCDIRFSVNRKPDLSEQPF